MAYPHLDSRPGDDPPAGLVRAELDRILASELFTRSERLSAFLKFTVEETLAGRGDSLKEQVIAVELYGKAADFNTAADPIVRVDARRLRDRLREYYATAPERGVVISVPKGSYTPAFHLRPSGVAAPASPDAAAARIQSSISWRWWIVTAGLILIAAVALGTIGPRMDRSEPPRLLTLTSMPGAEEDPSFSPDGNLVTFSWSPAPDADHDIWVKAVDGDARRNITNTPDALEKYPRWSPDGQWIAFSRVSKGKPSVLKVSPLGGPEQTIAEGFDATWTPDSRALVMTWVRPDGRTTLVHHVLETGARRQLTEAPVGFVERHPRVSPDGTRVAFERIGNGRSAIFLVPLSGGEPVTLGDWTSGITGGLEWMPDGREVLVGWPSPSGRRLVRIDVSAGGRRIPVSGIPYESISPAVSRVRDRETYRLAIVSGQQDVGLRLIDLEGPRQERTIATDSPFSDASRMDSPGRFSPDGSQIAFASDRTGNQQIWVANRDGSSLRSITQLKDAAVSVGGWSPDGQSVSFDATMGDRTDIYVVSVNDGRVRRLTEGTGAGIDPEWSRDGRWIYFASNEAGRSTIWKMPAAGGQAVQLTTEIGFEPRESPDGRSIYFIDVPRSGMGPVTRLKRIPAAGGPSEVVNIPVMPGAWEVTDTGIIFIFVAGRAGRIDPANGPVVVQLYDFQERRLRTLGDLRFIVGPFGASHFFTASRDGRWALASHVDRWDRDILLLDNFR